MTVPPKDVEDLFSRNQTFKNLEEKIEEHKAKGGAIIIHALWGIGKTWFAENCKALWENQNKRKVHLININPSCV